ncbi:hypothetical protein EC973_007254 [Apophysomyces ossiformis]|uniref:Adhesin domain-containing protein n=1 Tax=Apophysomyces ossiformis TaxID=679940 RepID=A0A8H7ERT8_9FUNG|nr:hypothetical protein EC973_007254 [Apophysomyces ossiformis]
MQHISRPLPPPPPSSNTIPLGAPPPYSEQDRTIHYPPDIPSKGNAYPSHSHPVHPHHSQLVIRQKNKKIELSEAWRGELCDLETMNSQICLEKRIWAERWIRLKTVNAKIRVADELLAPQIHIDTTNSQVKIKSCVAASDLLRIATDNARIEVKESARLEGSRIYVETTNSRVHLDDVRPSKLLRVKTSNGSINVNVLRASPSVKAIFKTSNSSVVVHFPTNFVGYFRVKTSKSGKALVNSSNIFLDVDEPNEKVGRQGSGDGYIDIETSSADAELVFDK